MGRPSSSVPGRGLLFLLLATVLLWAAYDLVLPQSVLRSAWRWITSSPAPVEGVRDDLVDRLGIPR